MPVYIFVDPVVRSVLRQTPRGRICRQGSRLGLHLNPWN
jgi:hypothetical protein